MKFTSSAGCSSNTSELNVVSRGSEDLGSTPSSHFQVKLSLVGLRNEIDPFVPKGECCRIGFSSRLEGKRPGGNLEDLPMVEVGRSLS
jgi:hypothetical protein